MNQNNEAGKKSSATLMACGSSAYLKGVMQHLDDLVVVVCDGHLQVQTVKFGQVSVRLGSG